MTALTLRGETVVSSHSMRINIGEHEYEVGTYVKHLAEAVNCIWLYAENWTAVAFMRVGTQIQLEGETWRAVEILGAQALSPNDPYSDFLFANRRLTSTELFLFVAREGALILQTCIARDGESRWGRRFIICEKES